MKRSLMRPTAALFPAVLLAATLLGDRDVVIRLFLCWLMIQLFSLCSADAFRNAAAREPGVRRVDKRFGGAWTTMLLGIILMLAAIRLFFGVNPFEGSNIVLPAAAICIYVEQLFEERMYALGKKVDGVMLGVISNALLAAGLLMDAKNGVAAPVALDDFYTICGAGLGMLISVVSSYIIEPMHAFSLAPRNIAFFPKAAVQSLLYPAATILGLKFGWEVFAGLILWRLSRTVCRRAGDESRSLNLLLMAAAAVPVVATLWLGQLAACASAMTMAMLYAVIVFCAPGWRIYTGAALLIAANVQLRCGIIPKAYGIYAVIALSAAAVILNTHKAFLKKV